MIGRVLGGAGCDRKARFGIGGWRAIATGVWLGLLGLSAVGQLNQDVAGTWQGTLQRDNGLRIVMKVAKQDAGWAAVWRSIDRGGGPVAVTSFVLQGSTVSFSISVLHLAYLGHLNPDGQSITGDVTQDGETRTLNLQRATEATAWPIPEAVKAMPADASPKFEVATIKPSDPDEPGQGFTGRGRHQLTIKTNTNDLIMYAYGLHAKQIVGGPDWFSTDKFDIDGVPDVEGQPNHNQAKMMIASLLADRFKLVFHHEQRELSVYALTVGKNGPKLTATMHRPSDPIDFSQRRFGELTASNVSMQDFCEGMQSRVMDRPVVDHTGLPGHYDFALKWTRDASQSIQLGAGIPSTTDDPNEPPGLFTAIQEQLGLKLESVRAMADVVVIDYVVKPSAN